MKKNSYQMSIIRGKKDHNSRCLCKPCENSLFSSLSLLVKSFEEEIQLSGDRVNTVRY